LRQRSEKLFVDAFHKALHDGAADELLDSLRPVFDKAAENVAAAHDLIPPTAQAEEFLATARPAALTAWQGLNKHLSVIGQVGSVAAAFGPRNGNFPLIAEYALGAGFRLDDGAIWCTHGSDLEADSTTFRQPDRGHRTSPWYRIPLRLNTVSEAKERYRVWAESQWDATHYTRTIQRQTPDGGVEEFELRNPYARMALAK
jgi:hypothetical protein